MWKFQFPNLKYLYSRLPFPPDNLFKISCNLDILSHPFHRKTHVFWQLIQDSSHWFVQIRFSIALMYIANYHFLYLLCFLLRCWLWVTTWTKGWSYDIANGSQLDVNCPRNDVQHHLIKLVILLNIKILKSGFCQSFVLQAQLSIKLCWVELILLMAFNSLSAESPISFFHMFTVIYIKLHLPCSICLSESESGQNTSFLPVLRNILKLKPVNQKSPPQASLDPLHLDLLAKHLYLQHTLFNIY